MNPWRFVQPHCIVFLAFVADWVLVIGFAAWQGTGFRWWMDWWTFRIYISSQWRDYTVNMTGENNSYFRDSHATECEASGLTRLSPWVCLSIISAHSCFILASSIMLVLFNIMFILESVWFTKNNMQHCMNKIQYGFALVQCKSWGTLNWFFPSISFFISFSYSLHPSSFHIFFYLFQNHPFFFLPESLHLALFKEASFPFSRFLLFPCEFFPNPLLYTNPR